MTMIVNMILDALVTQLTTVCQTNVPEADLTYADIVKKGLLQENKIKKNVGIGVTGGDHDDPNYLDGIVTLGAFENVAFQVPPREIGGGQMWWRRGVVRVEAFFVREKLDEDEAFEKAYEVLGRCSSAIEGTQLSGLTDDYDEHAIKMLCYANTYFESGGKPNQFIFRGKLYWMCLTERP